MEGGFCNIQVLLRAAEFLERRERGKYFMVSAFSKGKKLVIVKTTKCTANGVVGGKRLKSGLQVNELLPRLSRLWSLNSVCFCRKVI